MNTTETPGPPAAAQPSALQASAQHEASYGPIARRLRRWLGISHQRLEFNQLGEILSVKDTTVESHGNRLDAHAGVIDRAVAQINRNTAFLGNALERLAWYESRVPGIAGAKKAFDLAAKRETARREKLIAGNPHLTPEQQLYVRQSGKLPEPSSETPEGP